VQPSLYIHSGLVREAVSTCQFVKMASLQNIIQRVVWVEGSAEKCSFILQFLNMTGHGSTKSLLLVNTKYELDELQAFLYNGGYSSISLHHYQSQRERQEILHIFRAGRCPILIATANTASAGSALVIPTNVDYVINYSMPSDIMEYLRRIRHAGGEQMGLAISLLTNDDERNVDFLHDLTDLLYQTGQKVPQWMQTWTHPSPPRRTLTTPRRSMPPLSPPSWHSQDLVQFARATRALPTTWIDDQRQSQRAAIDGTHANNETTQYTRQGCTDQGYTCIAKSNQQEPQTCKYQVRSVRPQDIAVALSPGQPEELHDESAAPTVQLSTGGTQAISDPMPDNPDNQDTDLMEWPGEEGDGGSQPVGNLGPDEQAKADNLHVGQQSDAGGQESTGGSTRDPQQAEAGTRGDPDDSSADAEGDSPHEKDELDTCQDDCPPLDPDTEPETDDSTGFISEDQDFW
jgi:superfamily II DNA/RNA helicase